MFWAAAAQTVAQCAAACAGDGSMYLIAIYLFAFQVGIMPPGSLHRTRCTTGGFLFGHNGIIYAEIYRLIYLSSYRQNGLEALLTLYDKVNPQCRCNILCRYEELSAIGSREFEINHNLLLFFAANISVWPVFYFRTLYKNKESTDSKCHLRYSEFVL